MGDSGWSNRHSTFRNHRGGHLGKSPAKRAKDMSPKGYHQDLQKPNPLEGRPIVSKIKASPAKEGG